MAGFCLSVVRYNGFCCITRVETMEISTVPYHASNHVTVRPLHIPTNCRDYPSHLLLSRVDFIIVTESVLKVLFSLLCR